MLEYLATRSMLTMRVQLKVHPSSQAAKACTLLHT